MKASVKNMLNYHAPNSDTFQKFVDQSLMPNEYGGKAGKVQDIKNNFIKEIESQREYLTCNKRWRAREVNNNSMENTQSSFLELSID